MNFALSIMFLFLSDTEIADLTAELILRKHIFWNKDNLWILALLACREASHNTLISIVETVCSILWKVVMNPVETTDVEMVMSILQYLLSLLLELFLMSKILSSFLIVVINRDCFFYS